MRECSLYGSFWNSMSYIEERHFNSTLLLLYIYKRCTYHLDNFKSVITTEALVSTTQRNEGEKCCLT